MTESTGDDPNGGRPAEPANAPSGKSHGLTAVAAVAAGLALGLVVLLVIVSLNGSDHPSKDASPATTASVTSSTTATKPTATPTLSQPPAPTTVKSAGSMLAEAMAAETQLAKSLGAVDQSRISTGSCGTFALIVQADRITFWEWNGTKWRDRSSLLGSEGQGPGDSVTSGDFTYDGVIDFLVGYNEPRAAHGDYGGVFAERDCNWSWVEIGAAGSGQHEVDSLSYDAENHQLNAIDYKPEGGRGHVVLRYDADNHFFEEVWVPDSTPANPAPPPAAETKQIVGTRCRSQATGFAAGQGPGYEAYVNIYTNVWSDGTTTPGGISQTDYPC